VLFLFAVGGASFLQSWASASTRSAIAGGIMLFLIALEMVFARESGTANLERAASRPGSAPTSPFSRSRFPFISDPARSRSCF
jgi:small neutral amino acid transporter SnatA (MarC family)